MPFPFFALSRRRLSCFSVLLVFLFLTFFHSACTWEDTQHRENRNRTKQSRSLLFDALVRQFDVCGTPAWSEKWTARALERLRKNRGKSDRSREKASCGKKWNETIYRRERCEKWKKWAMRRHGKKVSLSLSLRKSFLMCLVYLEMENKLKKSEREKLRETSDERTTDDELRMGLKFCTTSTTTAEAYMSEWEKEENETRKIETLNVESGKRATAYIE